MLPQDQFDSIISNIIELKKSEKSASKKIKTSAVSDILYEAPIYPEYWDGYGLSVKWMQSIKPHAQKGCFPDLLFARQTPNETPAEREYVRSNFKQVTLSVFNDYIDTNGRAYHENNWNIDYQQDNDLYINNSTTLKQYLEVDFPEYGSLENFVFTFLPPLKFMDAMGVVAVIPEFEVIENQYGENIIDPLQLIRPVPMFFHCNKIVGFDSDYVIIESDEHSVVEKNGKMVECGIIYLIFDKTDIYLYRQVGKYVDYEFELKLYFNHNLGYVPVKFVDGKTTQIGDIILQQSQFLYAVDILDEVLLDASLLRGIKPKVCYPYRIMIGDPCEFQQTINGETVTCDNGYFRTLTTVSECPSCHGSGTKDRISPHGVMLLKPPTSSTPGDNINPSDAMFYASPSTENPVFIRSEIESGLVRAKESLHLKTTQNKVQGSADITATEAASDMKALISSIKQNCNQLFDMYEWLIDTIGIMRYGDNYKKPLIQRPVNFDFYTESEQLAQISELRNGNQPTILIQAAVQKLLQSTYYSDIQSQKFLKLILATDRLMVMTNDDINQRLAKRLIDPYEVILHDSANLFITDLIRENPKFFEQDFTDQQIQLIDAAKAKYAQIQSSNTILIAPVVPAAAAAANLVG